jgi:hypothetical protein
VWYCDPRPATLFYRETGRKKDTQKEGGKYVKEREGCRKEK